MVSGSSVLGFWNNRILTIKLVVRHSHTDSLTLLIKVNVYSHNELKKVLMLFKNSVSIYLLEKQEKKDQSAFNNKSGSYIEFWREITPLTYLLDISLFFQ